MRLLQDRGMRQSPSQQLARMDASVCLNVWQAFHSARDKTTAHQISSVSLTPLHCRRKPKACLCFSPNGATKTDSTTSMQTVVPHGSDTAKKNNASLCPTRVGNCADRSRELGCRIERTNCDADPPVVLPDSPDQVSLRSRQGRMSA